MTDTLIREITLEDARSALNAAVARRGRDTIVKACVYAQDGKPHCIVGQALAELGWSIEAIEDLNGSEEHDIDDSPNLSDLFSIDQIKITDQALTYLSTAQNCQDSGMMWGEALDRAEATAV